MIAARFLWRCDKPPRLETSAGIFGGLGLQPPLASMGNAALRSAGKPPKFALVAVMRKLLRNLHRCQTPRAIRGRTGSITPTPIHRVI